jgi:hypothetical protein
MNIKNIKLLFKTLSTSIIKLAYKLVQSCIHLSGWVLQRVWHAVSKMGTTVMFRKMVIRVVESAFWLSIGCLGICCWASVGIATGVPCVSTLCELSEVEIMSLDSPPVHGEFLDVNCLPEDVNRLSEGGENLTPAATGSTIWPKAGIFAHFTQGLFATTGFFSNTGQQPQKETKEQPRKKKKAAKKSKKEQPQKETKEQPAPQKKVLRDKYLSKQRVDGHFSILRYITKPSPRYAAKFERYYSDGTSDTLYAPCVECPDCKGTGKCKKKPEERTSEKKEGNPSSNNATESKKWWRWWSGPVAAGATSSKPSKDKDQSVPSDDGKDCKGTGKCKKKPEERTSEKKEGNPSSKPSKDKDQSVPWDDGEVDDKDQSVPWDDEEDDDKGEHTKSTLDYIIASVPYAYWGFAITWSIVRAIWVVYQNNRKDKDK